MENDAEMTPLPQESQPLYAVWDVLHDAIPDLPKFSSIPTSHVLAKAFANPLLTPLHVYRAASLLREGVLREIVQFLTFEGTHAASTAVRLMVIMRGLPGNLELAHMFLQQNAHSFSQFEPRTLTFLAFICGPQLQTQFDWSPVIEQATENECPEAKLALSCLFEVNVHEPMEPLPHLTTWDNEKSHAKQPSFWRELRWASLARALSLASDPVLCHSGQDSKKDIVEALPSSYGGVATHYVRLCGIMTRRRSVPQVLKYANTTHTEDRKSADEKELTPSVVITKTIRHALKDVGVYLSYGKSFVLEGPTGCGKTTILSHLAKETLYDDAKPLHVSKTPGVTFIQMDSAMVSTDGDSFVSLVGEVVPLPAGGGFTWRAGPIGLAAQRGEWLIFENISRGDYNMSSALAVILQLANAEPGDLLDAPGRGEPIRIARGFRCIATRTTSQRDGDDSWEPPGGWKTWKRVRMQGLSTCEKVDLLKVRFSSIQDCIDRVVSAVERTAAYAENNMNALMRYPTMRETVRICHRLESTRKAKKALSVEDAIAESYDVLGANCHSNAEHDNVLRILAESWSLNVEIARDLCLRHQPQLVSDNNLLRIGRGSFSRASKLRKRFQARLALNGHTTRLLEKGLRCLQMKEHMLLVGETGSGKTSIIQELASMLNHELVVVNLSRQSDIGDLIGGFKPVELEDALSALGRRFEGLFCQVMSKQKNARFLDAVQRACSSRESYDRAVRLMTGALKAFPKRSLTCRLELQEEWDAVTKSLEKLRVSISPSSTVYNTKASSSVRSSSRRGDEPPRKRHRSSPQPESSMTDTEQARFSGTTGPGRSTKKLDFVYSEGVLVKAMREGKWVLLDEINLAPPELLERLVSIMDRGEVVLANEKGDIVSQSPGFSLFGAMNPPTDVGKRYLPEVLRSRFSEVFVGDVTDREDIVKLAVLRFFQLPSHNDSTGLSQDEYQVASDVTSFYIECCSLAKGGHIEDNDGRPVRYSLRAFSRMLDFAAALKAYAVDGLSTVRRILYEGALVAFCTALPMKSRTKIAQTAQSIILEKYKELTTRQSMTSLITVRGKGTQVLAVEGFPIESRRLHDAPNPPEESSFVLSSAVRRTLKDICRILLIGAPRLPILLQGPTASGKTSTVTYLARLTGNKLIRINNHEHTELSEYVGGYVATASGSLVFSEGPLVQAARSGHWVLLDELNLAPPDVLESLNRLLDDNREIFIPETGETVRAHNNFRLFATQNPPGLYGGRKELSKAFRSRFVELRVEELPDEDLFFILERRSGIPRSFTRRMIAVMRELQMKRKTSGLFSGREGFVTARDLFRWASRRPRSKEELAMHGFFLLGERSRLFSEREVVRDVIIKHTDISRQTLSDESLFSLNIYRAKLSESEESFLRSLKILSIDKDQLMESLTNIGIALTPKTKRILSLVTHCIAHDEPVLLVGATGGGKTTICSALCDAIRSRLLTINCHRHTEASDVLGGFRPVRTRNKGGAVFEWSDGPLVRAMKEGHSFLIDEINMAEDAVIERLNSVLEPQRCLLLSERGAVLSEGSLERGPEVIVGHPKFRILATMNPGGDFGKRELSPALRNRFTELWIPQPDSLQDFIPIIEDRLKHLLETASKSKTDNITGIMRCFLDECLRAQSTENGPSSGSDTKLTALAEFRVSLRDLRAWCDFVVSAVQKCDLDPVEALMHGARVVFLDGMSVGSASTRARENESKVWYLLLSLASADVVEALSKCRYTSASQIRMKSTELIDQEQSLRIDNFILYRNPRTKNRKHVSQQTRFCFDAPNAKRNVARLTRALAVTSRPILLEGPPGCGKSSLIAAMASVSGNLFVRINLSESTEMTDLIGTDAPDGSDGSFGFREGPLLNAMRQGSWVLLDELNLASQTVLEGLNSLLDHRRSLFVPETNETVIADCSFRMFGAQNPAIDGGGRRGLPNSFVNRFTRVDIVAPSSSDVLFVVQSLHSMIPADVLQRIVTCLGIMKERTANKLENNTDFGLRDALRWCDVLSGIVSKWSLDLLSHRDTNESKEYLRVSFDVSVLQGLNGKQQRSEAESVFESVFGFSWKGEVQEPSLRPGGDFGLRIGLGYLQRRDNEYCVRNVEPLGGLIHSSQLRALQAMALSVQGGWPVVLICNELQSSENTGKELVELLGMGYGKKVKTIHGCSLVDAESLVGGYSQKNISQCLRQLTSLASDLFHIMIRAAEGNTTPEKGPRNKCLMSAYWEYRDMFEKCYKSADYKSLQFNSVQSHTQKDIELFVLKAEGFMYNARRLLQDNDLGMDKVNKMNYSCMELLNVVALQDARGAPSFEWKKSDLVNAIENGEWVYVEGAQRCSPAVLDRLNPLFERPALSSQDLLKKHSCPELFRVLLAEAPSENDGTPVYMKPHPDFRVFFAVSTSSPRIENYGLSRPLLDRCLRICFESSTEGSDPDLFLPSNRQTVYNSRCWLSLSRGLFPDSRLLYAVGLVAQPNVEEVQDKCSLEKGSAVDVANSPLLRRGSDFVLAPATECVSGDIWSVEQLALTAEVGFEDLMRKTSSFSQPILHEIMATSHDSSDPGNKPIAFYRAELMSNVLKALFLGSSSGTDLMLRAMTLRSSGISRDVRAIVDELMNAAQHGLSLIPLTRDEVKEIACDRVMSAWTIDPIFAMDRLPIMMGARSSASRIAGKLRARAKAFRIEIMALYGFETAWERSISSKKSVIARAHLKSELQSGRHGKWENEVQIELICYELLASAARNLTLFRNAVQRTDGWDLFYEAEVFDMFDVLLMICNTMARDKTNKPYLLALLHRVSYLGEKLCADQDFAGLDFLHTMIPKIQAACEAIQVFSFMNQMSLMPRSRRAQLVERKLLKRLTNGQRPLLGLDEVDAIVKAAVTLSVKFTVENDQLLNRFDEIAGSTKQKTYSISDWAQAMPHFRSAVYGDYVSTMEKCFVSVIHAAEGRHEKKPKTYSLRSIVDSLCYQLRCVPAADAESLLVMQRRSWILECLETEEKNSPSSTDLDVVEGDLLLLSVLRERNAFVRGLSRDEDTDTATQLGHDPFLTTLQRKDKKPEILSTLDAVPMQAKCSYLASLWQDGAFNSIGSKFSETTDYENLAVSRTAKFLHESPVIDGSGSHRDLLYGSMAWIAIGAYRIICYVDIIQRMNGNDPSAFAQMKTVVSFESIMKFEARLKAFTSVHINRTGGDCLQSCRPVEMICEQIRTARESLKQSRSYYIYRNPEEAGFESFVDLVGKVKASVIDVISQSGFMGRAEVNGIRADPGLVQEASHLIQVCREIGKALSICGSHSHFRDISLSLRLGLEELQTGLSAYINASEQIEHSKCDWFLTKRQILSDLCLLPRAACKAATEISEAISSCAKIAPTGEALLATAQFLLQSHYIPGDPSPQYSSFLSGLVSVWKASKLRHEQEDAERESLHLLRQASQRYEIDAEAALGTSTELEQEDFCDTFNPISEEVEEGLIGISQSCEDSEPPKMKANTHAELENGFLTIDSMRFWDLHQSIFPGISFSSSNGLSIQHDVETIISFAKDLSSYVQESRFFVIGSNGLGGIWPFLCSESITRMLRGMKSVPKPQNLRTRYNFYTDSNIAEVRTASTLLLELRKAVGNIQSAVSKGNENEDHPVLSEIVSAIDRVARVTKTSTPLSIVVMGLENVLRKADEWNRLFGSRETKLTAELVAVSKLVLRWRALEMNSWPLILESRKQSFEQKATKWIFLLYDAVVTESLSQKFLEESHCRSVISTVDQFLRSSPSGEFCRRLEIVNSVSHHLLSLRGVGDVVKHIGRGLRGLCRFYKLFEEHLDKELSRGYESVLQELREFTSIVSYNPEADLGSSMEMSKQNNKHLDYFRLKAASEKTRRRMHKLCLKVDSVLRDPFYRHMTDMTSSIGLAGIDFGPPMTERESCSTQSHYIACTESILKAMLVASPAPLNSGSLTALSQVSGDSYISKFETLQRKLFLYGQNAKDSKHGSCEEASKFAFRLRCLIRERVKRLRQVCAGKDIQPKRRALVDLLRGLHKVGLSPFERRYENQSLEWICAVDPTSDEVFNATANDLYFAGVHRYQTLRNLSDSSVRSNDINSGEASRIRAFCHDLLDKACIERKELNQCYDIIQSLHCLANSLVTTRGNTSSTFHVDNDLFNDYCELILRLRKAKSDVKKIIVIIEDAVSREVDVQELMCSNETVRQTMKFYNDIGQKPLRELHTLLSLTFEAIENEPKDVGFVDLKGKRYQEMMYFDGRFQDWCEAVQCYLRSLCNTLKEVLQKAGNVSNDNIVTQLLAPLLALVQEGVSKENGEKRALFSQPSETCKALCESLHKNIEEFVRTILISAQNVMAWCAAGSTMENELEKELPTEESALEVFPRLVLKHGHQKIVRLGSDLGLSRLHSCAEKNAEILNKLISSRFCLSRTELNDIVVQQRALGGIMKEYLNSMLLPCTRKASTQHCEDLALLRTLTSLFIGLCKDGFCRPPDEDEVNDSREVETSAGAGFGDVGDGDLTGAQDVSEQIEDEEQLLGLRNETSKTAEEQKNEHGNRDGYEMQNDFEGDLEELDTGENGDSEELSDAEKQMGHENSVGENTLNEKLWDENEAEGINNPDESQHKGENDDNLENPSSNSGGWAAGERREEQNSKLKTSQEQEVGTDEEHSDSEEPKDDNESTASNQEPGLGGQENDVGQHLENMKTDKPQDLDSRNKAGEEGLESTHDVLGGEDPEANECDVRDDVSDAQAEERDAQENEAEDPSNEPMLGRDSDAIEWDENHEKKESGDGLEGIPEDPQLPEGEGEERDEDEIGSVSDVEDMDIDVNKDDTSTGDGDLEPQPERSAREDNVETTPSEPQESENAEVGTTSEKRQNVEPETTATDAMSILPGESTTEQPDQDRSTAWAAFANQGSGSLEFRGGRTETVGDQHNRSEQRDDKLHSGHTDQENATIEGDGQTMYESSRKQKGEENQRGLSTEGTNPLRISDSEDLVKKWDECISVIRDQADESLIPPRNSHDEDGADVWEFETNKTADEAPRHALGTASAEQQRPLPQDEGPESSRGEKSKSEQEKDMGGLADGQPHITEEKTLSHIPPLSPTRTDGNLVDLHNGQLEIPHPARSATNQTQQYTALSNHSPQRGEKLSYGKSTMEVDSCEGSSEPKPKHQINRRRIEDLDHAEAKGLWQALESKVSTQATTLCEQLRLVLEPTKASRMGGAYRTGKRLNMKKVIEYVASDFRRDRIWLRRVKPDKRTYDVLIAIDDSASMVESNAGIMATESLALVTTALSKLEVGRVAVASFGADAKLVRNFEEPLPISTESGAKLLRHFTFSQTETNIVNLLSFVHTHMAAANCTSELDHISLAFIISDGRLSDREEVRRHLRRLRESNVLVAFLILDQTEHEDSSIYNVKRVEYDSAGKMRVNPYMQDFPIDFYAVIQDVQSLPTTVADALRQWIEATSY
ncbi:Midasin [Gracilariopsis chorda]|uniref:Midasin n=1 Tax=Gracilariopsis chorda TaxID=448386 RepID=A0A2V3IML8_9FLOR|nr:Midasin [Gracilariopsis chorda]|eukprot:PXF43299.1 Midasin [Gracilariopsis chorda]